MGTNRFGDTISTPVSTNRFGDSLGMSVTSRLTTPVMQDAQTQAVEDELAATASKEQQLGAPFASRNELAPSGISGFLLRADLARSNRPDEKVMKLQAARPDYEVRQVETDFGPKPVFRAPGADAFSPIDTPGGSFVGDTADLAGSLVNTENLAGMLGAIMTQGRSLLPRILASGGASMAGNVADRSVEDARGFETGTPDEQKLETGAAGIAAVGGETLGSLVTGIKGIGTGERGLIKPDDRGKEALRIIEENPGMGNLSAGQIFPIFQRKENQAAATGNTIKDFREQQGEKIAASIRGAVPESNVDVFSDQALMAAVDQMEKDMLAQTGERKGNEVAVRSGGKALQQGREAYRQGSREWVDERYKTAMSKATPDIKFDISKAQAEAGDALKGVVAKGPDSVAADTTGELPVVTPGKDVRLAVDFSGPMRSAVTRLIASDDIANASDVKFVEEKQDKRDTLKP